MTDAEISWEFPSNNGGRIDGFNDPGIAHFSGQRVSRLAREVIQNALDARKDKNEPVHVSFELVTLKSRDFGRDELMKAVLSCQEENDDPVFEDQLKEAENSLSGDYISCLRISDRNTTGLVGNNWKSLIKMQGVSHKTDQGAGGSHGIGKYAPFAISSARTVFYWTCYEENEGLVERCQGKSVLMSHKDKSTQGTGFYGVKDGCQEIPREKIPDSLRLLQNGKPICGTSILILGPQIKESEWRSAVAASVLENFFYAIEKNMLNVMIEPKDNDEVFEVNSGNLQYWFEKFIKDEGDSEEGDPNAISQAKMFWQISSGKLTAGVEQFDTQDKDLGHCRLWVKVDKGLTSRVGLVRRTGMLITDQQKKLTHFPSYQDFAALCFFEDPNGNELLRRMENPSHDQFEPERLSGVQVKEGERALKNIAKWIRDRIRELAYTSSTGQTTLLPELAKLLPDYYPDEEFEDSPELSETEGEPGFAERIKVKLKPIRRSVMAPLPIFDDEQEDFDGDGEDTGNFGGERQDENGGDDGNGSGIGPNEGDGSGGVGSRGGMKGKRLIQVSRVRVLPIPDRSNCRRISFIPGKSGLAMIRVDEAGDSALIPRDDIRSADGTPFELVRLKEGERCTIDIMADDPLEGCALWVAAYESETQ